MLVVDEEPVKETKKMMHAFLTEKLLGSQDWWQTAAFMLNFVPLLFSETRKVAFYTESSWSICIIADTSLVMSFHCLCAK